MKGLLLRHRILGSNRKDLSGWIQVSYVEVTNLSTGEPPSEDAIDTMIYKSKIVRDYLLDVAEMLDELEASGN